MSELLNDEEEMTASDKWMEELNVQLMPVYGLASYNLFWARTDPKMFEEIRAAEEARHNRVGGWDPYAAETFRRRACQCRVREPWVITPNDFVPLNARMQKNRNIVHYLVIREVNVDRKRAEDMARKLVVDGINFCHLRIEKLGEEWADDGHTLEALMNTPKVRSITVTPGVPKAVATRLLAAFPATVTLDALQLCPEIHDQELAAWQLKRG